MRGTMTARGLMKILGWAVKFLPPLLRRITLHRPRWTKAYPYQDYYYIREIPNKPPPPYTPPGQAPVNGRPQLLDEFSGTAISSADYRRLTTEVFHPQAINYDKEELDGLIALATEHHLRLLSQLSGGDAKGLDEPTSGSPEPPLGYYDQDNDEEQGLSSVSRRVYKMLILDLVGEKVRYLHELDFRTPKPPWMKPEWPTSFSSEPSVRMDGIPATKETFEEARLTKVRQMVVQHLNLWSKSGGTFSAPTWQQSLPLVGQRTRAYGNGLKKHDFVDDMLLYELQQEESEWINYERDEVDVKMQLRSSILDVLLTETIQIAKSMHDRRFGSSI